MFYFFVVELVFKKDISFDIGVCSTLFSIVLSIVSMFYTYISGEKTSDSLDKLNNEIETIDNQNKKLVDEIHNRLIRENFGETNINSLYTK